MKDVQIISLGGIVLAFEQDAKSLVGRYLEKSRAKLHKDEAADEILQDLELAIATHLAEKGISEKRAATKLIVEEVLNGMGDIDGEPIDVKSRADWRRWFQKPFHPSKSNRVIFGICGGLADLIGIDAFWLRLLFLLLAFVTEGWFFGAYIMAGIVFNYLLDDDNLDRKTAASVRTASMSAKADTQNVLRQLDQATRKVFRWLIISVSIVGLLVSVAIASITLVIMLGRTDFDIPLIGYDRTVMSYVFVLGTTLLFTWLFGLQLYASIFPKKQNIGHNAWSLFGTLLITVILMSAFVTSTFHLRNVIRGWALRHPGNGLYEIRRAENGQDDVCFSPFLTCDDPRNKHQVFLEDGSSEVLPPTAPYEE